MESFGEQLTLVRTDYWEDYTNEEIANLFESVLGKEIKIDFIGGDNDLHIRRT